MAEASLTFVDDDGAEVRFDRVEAQGLYSLTGSLEAATVSACPGCRSAVLAVVALVDLLDESPPHPRGPELIELADDAPTLHLYVVDEASACDHRSWHDPGHEEWVDALDRPIPRVKGP